MKRPAFSHPRFAKLSVQFFLNYMLLFLLLVLIGLVAIGGSFAYIYSQMDLAALDFDVSEVYKDIETSSLEQAFLKAKLPPSSYIEIIDSNLTVLDQYNSIHPLGFTYRQDLFNRILINYFPEYTFYYPDGSDTILLVVTPEFQQNMNFIQMILITFSIVLICLIVAVLIYARVTSVVFLKPINHLLAGVNRIREGDYSTRIQFNSRNELDELMTAINLMAERIKQEIDLRERSEKNQKQLILDISHDLKTPLTNIQGYTETLLQAVPEENALMRQHLEIVYNNSHRANSVLRDLFDLARLENSPTEPLLEPTDICEFLRLTSGGYIQELEANAMDYDFIIPDLEWYASINPGLMERAIGNLLNNGIKYAGAGTTLTVRVEKNHAGHVMIAIEDNGLGIESEAQTQVFLPFYRTDASRSSRTGGTGLGLAISKAIVEKNRGSLWLDPQHTPGCRFVIELPPAAAQEIPS